MELEDAVALAARAHKGQRDKGRKPYILHPLRVMLRMITTEEMVVAVLHDIIEDTEVTLDDLRSHGLDEKSLLAVDALTRRDAEPYETFIARVAKNPLARAVKAIDLLDNLDPVRLIALDHDERERLTVKYRAALQELYKD